MAVSLQRPHAAVACLLLYCLTGSLSIPDPRQREALIEQEASMQTGGQMVLTDAEKRLDAVLFKMKREEMMRADFPPAMHFFKARPLIRSSPIFGLLQKMPKGVFNLTSQRVFITSWLASYSFAIPFCSIGCLPVNRRLLWVGFGIEKRITLAHFVAWCRKSFDNVSIQLWTSSGKMWKMEKPHPY